MTCLRDPRLGYFLLRAILNVSYTILIFVLKHYHTIYALNYVFVAQQLIVFLEQERI